MARRGAARRGRGVTEGEPSSKLKRSIICRCRGEEEGLIAKLGISKGWRRIVRDRFGDSVVNERELGTAKESLVIIGPPLKWPDACLLVSY